MEVFVKKKILSGATAASGLNQKEDRILYLFRVREYAITDPDCIAGE